MISIKPAQIYNSLYKYCPRNNLHKNTFLYDNEKYVYHLSENFKLKHVGKLHDTCMPSYGGVSFHPEKYQVGFLTKDKSISVCDFNNNLLWEKKGEFTCVIFSSDGELLWACEEIDSENIKIWVFNSQNGDVYSVYNLNDDLYDSRLNLSDIPNSKNIILQLAAGQDGVLLYELSLLDEEINARVMFGNVSYITPAFKFDGLKFLTLDNDDFTLAHFSFPDLKPLSIQNDIDFDDEDSSPSYSMIYLKNDFFIVQSSEYCLYLIDTIKMEVLSEIVLTKDVVNPLKDDNSLYSEILSLDRVGDVLIATTVDDHILLFSENDFTEEIIIT